MFCFFIAISSLYVNFYDHHHPAMDLMKVDLSTTDISINTCTNWVKQQVRQKYLQENYILK